MSRGKDAGEKEACEQQPCELNHERKLKRMFTGVQNGLPRPSKVRQVLINSAMREVADENVPHGLAAYR